MMKSPSLGKEISGDYSNKNNSFYHSKGSKYKTLEEQIATRYRRISLFGWYPPEGLKNQKKMVKNDQNLLDQSLITGGVTNTTVAPNYAQAFPYDTSSNFGVTEKKRNQGNTPFIRYPTQGFLPYNSGHEILKSCDINFPLKLNLLCVRELARSFSKFIHAGKVDANSLISIPMIKYVVP